MDQIKDVLKQLIKYRFWIAVVVSAILPVVAYVVGSGPIKLKAEQITKEIKDAKTDVEKYASGVLPNRQYPPIVEEKTAAVASDVNAAWKKLYDRQAPTLTWPERVQERFRSWGRKWPENEDASRVQVAIIEYVNEYPAYVDEVYNTFRPFDPATGKGIVVAPPKEALLRPAAFKPDTGVLPDLTKVWAAQERLWVQRTLLEVVAEVNKKAKTWDAAIVRQVTEMEIGDAKAQDQQSLAKNQTLEEPPPITDPKAPPAPEPSSSSSSMSSMGNMGPMGGMGGMGGAAQAEASNTIFYLKTEPPSSQFKILPVHLAVLVEQDHIQDFLIGLVNSPMAIQVMDYDQSKPTMRVVKPEKGGEGLNLMGYGEGGSLGGMRNPFGGPSMTGFGGMGSMMMQQMRMRPGSANAMGGIGGGPLNAGPPGRTGVRREGDRKKEREEREKAAAKSTKYSLHDQYYNIVQVSVYGQARFYLPPPVEPTPEPSHGASTAAEAAAKEPAKDDATKTDDRSKSADKPKADETAKSTDKPKAEETTSGDKTKTEAAPKNGVEKSKEGVEKPKEAAATPKTDAAKPKDDDAKAKPAVPKPDPAATATPKK